MGRKNYCGLYIKILIIFRLCKKKLHQYHYQDCSDLMIVIVKILHLGEIDT